MGIYNPYNFLLFAFIFNHFTVYMNMMGQLWDSTNKLLVSFPVLLGNKEISNFINFQSVVNIFG